MMSMSQGGRKVVVAVRLSYEELKALRELAEREHLAPSQVIRRLLWREAQTERKELAARA